MDPQMKKAAYSLLRVFGAALAAQLLFQLARNGNNVFALDVQSVQMIVSSAVSAVALTMVNWFRTGDTRFGRTPPTPKPVTRKPRARKS